MPVFLVSNSRLSMIKKNSVKLKGDNTYIIVSLKEWACLLGGLVECQMTIQKTTFSFFCFSSLNSADIVSCFTRKTWSLDDCDHFTVQQSQVRLFFSIFYHFYILFVHITICAYFYLLGHIWVFFSILLKLTNLNVCYVYIKGFCTCKWAYLIFPSFYSVLVYHWYTNIGGARGVIAIIVGNGHGDASSNPRRDWLHFT